MPSSFSAITAVLALLTVVDATPVVLDKRGTFSLTQVERTRYLKNGPREKAKTLRKYGLEVPENVLAAAAARSDGASTYSAPGNSTTAPAVPYDEFDTLYLTPVTLGKDTLELDFDTGSSDLWTFSSLQKPSQLTGHAYYNTSSGTELKNATWSILYGDYSSAAGRVYTDLVTVGSVTATRQAIGAATAVSQQFQRDVEVDGIFGLGFSTLNTIRPLPQKTFFENVKDSLAEPVFAVTLKYRAAGSYDFGFIDESRYEGKITWVQANTTQGWWAFSSTSYRVGNAEETALEMEAIGDTGTTLTYLPSSVCSAYYASVPGAEDSWENGGWVFPCASSMPDFSYTIGGTRFVVSGKHLVYAPLSAGGTTCYGGIQDQAGMDFSIIGDTFLKSVYMVHEDRAGQKPRIGFAKQAGV